MTKSTTTPQAIVIVPGHDILVDATLALVDKGWVAGFPGEAVARMLHIWVAIAYATEQGNAIVVFSGGVTKLQTTLSEAQSYLDGAKYCRWIRPDGVGWLLEEFALDSPTNFITNAPREECHAPAALLQRRSRFDWLGTRRVLQRPLAGSESGRCR